MANNKNYTDQQNVEAAMVEYRPLKVGENHSIKGENGYIGNVSQIYDNVNGHEEQVFVFTNNGKGPEQSPVPYSASCSGAGCDSHDAGVTD